MNVLSDHTKQLKRFRMQLGAFVPPGGFDAHAHLYRSCDAIATLPADVADERGDVGWPAWRRAMHTSMGDSAPAAGLFFAFPHPRADVARANQFVLEQIGDQPGSRCLLLAKPTDRPEDLVPSDWPSCVAGFKVYHVYAGAAVTQRSSPAEFIPEWAWEIAHQRRLLIMLHIVRDRALADEINQQYIRERCERYPNAALVLAHAARGFNAAHTVEGVSALRGLDNVYFDTSAVCEAAAFEAVLREFGPSRLMFGSDFPVSEMVGRCVSVADSFAWLAGENGPWKSVHAGGPTLVGIESLLAVQAACRNLRLIDADVEQIFRANARRLLGIEAASRTQEPDYQSAKQIIPGGTQLLSKRPEMYAPDRWPAYYREAKGCRVTDWSGREFCDMTTSGIGSCLLGYADPDVSDAVIRRVQLGSMSTLNSAEELELAQLLVALHPWAEQVRFCRTGGESMALAVRLARAATGRDVVAFCGYHGWSDWYLAANLAAPGSSSTEQEDRLGGHLLPGLEPAGVPAGLAGTALPFAYNQLDQLRQIVQEHGDNLAAVVMEPFRAAEPVPGFLEGVRELCDSRSVVLVLDEITSGWRFALGGIHRQFGIEPDVAVFAKAIGNGHPLGAIIGRSRIMEAAQRTFASSTYWTEGVGPTAGLATIKKMQRIDVPSHVAMIGERLRGGLATLSRDHKVPLNVTGRPALLHIAVEHEDAAALGTLLTVRMLERGILASSGFYPSLAHEPRHVDAYLAAADEIFPELAAAMRAGDAAARVKGQVRHSGFARLT